MSKVLRLGFRSKSPLPVGHRGPCLIQCYLGSRECPAKCLSALARCTSVTDTHRNWPRAAAVTCVSTDGITLSATSPIISIHSGKSEEVTSRPSGSCNQASVR